MFFNINSRLVAIAVLIGCVAPSAHGSLGIYTSTLGGSAHPGQNYVDFNNLNLGSAGGTATGPSGSVGVSFAPDGQVVSGAASGFYAPPNLSGNNNLFFGPLYTGADNTKYVTSGANPASAAATLTWTSGQKYLGILWGSVDAYNALDFYDSANGLIGTITGAQVIAVPNGDQGKLGTRYVNINSNTAFVKVVARSNYPNPNDADYAFEFDNVAYGANQVPEMSTIAVWSVLSLLGAGVAYRRNAKQLS